MDLFGLYHRSKNIFLLLLYIFYKYSLDNRLTTYIYLIVISSSPFRALWVYGRDQEMNYLGLNSSVQISIYIYSLNFKQLERTLKALKGVRWYLCTYPLYIQSIYYKSKISPNLFLINRKNLFNIKSSPQQN